LNDLSAPRFQNVSRQHRRQPVIAHRHRGIVATQTEVLRDGVEIFWPLGQKHNFFLSRNRRGAKTMFTLAPEGKKKVMDSSPYLDPFSQGDKRSTPSVDLEQPKITRQHTA
jgi:hypothetical protein